MTLQVRIETLPAAYSSMVNVLGETGIGGSLLHEIISKNVRAECVLCRIEVKGDDLSAVALAARAEDLVDPRLARLKHGYCCRRSCDSYYYRLLFASHPAVNWEKVTEKLAGIKAQASSGKSEEEQSRPKADPVKKALVIRIAAGVGLVLVLLLCRHLLLGGSFPGLQRTSKYTVDPASIPGVPGH